MRTKVSLDGIKGKNMKPITSATFIILSIFLLTGCATLFPPLPPQKPTQEMVIITEPAGAHIEVNGAYQGTSPCTVPVELRNGNFPRDVTINALPASSGQYVQTKSFRVGDQVPETVFFIMHLQVID